MPTKSLCSIVLREASTSYILLDADFGVVFQTQMLSSSQFQVLHDQTKTHLQICDWWVYRALCLDQAKILKHTPYRHINTFEQQKQSQVSSSSRNRLQPPRTRDPADYSSKALGSRSTSNHSYRTGNGEPPFKRPRLDETKIPYVKDEAFGAVSPVFSSKLDSDVTTTRRRTSRTPARVRSPPKMVANDIPLTVHEYGSVEKMVKPLPASKVTSESLEVKSSKALLTGRHQPSDESDLETFTRQAKRQRYGRNDSPQVNSDHEVQVVEVAASDSEASKHTPEEIKSLFPPSYSPNHAQLSDGPHSSTLGALPTTTSSSQRPTESSLVASMEGVGDGKAAIKYHLMRKGTSALKGRRQKVSGSKSPDKQSAGFPLRWITYGLLPLSSDYYISIRDDMLEIRYSESQLSDDPVWHPIPLSKVFKILRGTDDCFILKLEFSNREGQSNQPMWLEFTSGEHRDKFVALVNRTNLPHMVLRKEE